MIKQIKCQYHLNRFRLKIQERGDVLKLKQGDIARKLQVTQAAVSYWNSGTNTPPLPMVMNLCEVLGCTVDALVHDPAREMM